MKNLPKLASIHERSAISASEANRSNDVKNEPLFKWSKGVYTVSTDKSLLDINFIHLFLSHTHWDQGINKETVINAIEHSLCFALYRQRRQIGFSRVVTDFATFAYICDVFVVPEYQGVGLGRWMITCCLEYPLMDRLRRIMLVTTRAPWLYQKTGFQPLNQANVVWGITRPDIYQPIAAVKGNVQLH